MGWQPIKTAPRDGTPLLLWLKEAIDRKYVTRGRCPNVTIGFADPDTHDKRWVSVETEDNGSMGGEYTGWMSNYECLDIEPSHWMPLPEPPTS